MRAVLVPNTLPVIESNRRVLDLVLGVTTETVVVVVVGDEAVLALQVLFLQRVFHARTTGCTTGRTKAWRRRAIIDIVVTLIVAYESPDAR